MNPVQFQTHVVIATKGRARETFCLLDYLAAQTLAPAHTVIVGSNDSDVAGLAAHPLVLGGAATILLAARAGLTIQRNTGLDAMAVRNAGLAPDRWCVVFFDDDFRPAPDWLARCAARFEASPEIIGLCGYVMADGIRGAGYDERTASEYLEGSRPPEAHWPHFRSVTPLPDGLYGCNMAYRGTAAVQERFDERLPLYGWQEDIDFAGRVGRRGKLVCDPACRGVHMGVQGARTSGLRFGYSQIANPVYMIRKGSMRTAFGARLMCRNLASNLFNSMRFNRRKDYYGRLRGNLMALSDALTDQLAPEKILTFQDRADVT